MIIVFQGLESAAHRDTLESVKDMVEGVDLVGSLSYKSLRSRRLGVSYVRNVAERFPLILEAGAFKASMTKDQALDAQEEYYSFLAEVPELVGAMQFDHPSLHQAMPTTMPTDARVVPIVFNEDDIAWLERVVDERGSVAMPYKGYNRRIAAILRRSAPEGHLYLAMASNDLESTQRAGFNAVMTNAWLAPAKYGEMSLWDGTKYHRVSAKGRDALLKAHIQTVVDAGFDRNLLHDADSREMQRLAAYSLLKWSTALPPAPDGRASDASSEPEAGGGAIEVRASAATPAQRREAVDLPGYFRQEVEGLEEMVGGGATLRTRQTVRPTGESLRVCDACFLRSNCPAFEAGSTCAFKFPVEVRSDAQMRSLLAGMVEMQATRVAFARFAEEVQGGYPDPTVGEEMDRLVRITERVQRLADRREKLTVSLESEFSGGGTGVLSKIFGGGKPAPLPVIEAQASDD